MSALKRHDDCVSDLAFDEWLADSTTPGLRRELEAHLAGCARCQARSEFLAAERAAFLARAPSWQALATRFARRPARPSIARSSRVTWAASAAIALAIALRFALPGEQTSGVRSKGGPHLGAFIKHGERVERAEPGSVVQAGDFVRFTYSSPTPVYFGLLNRDAQRAATYYPLDAQTVRVQAGSDVALDFSIRLDGEPGEERVHGLFCDRPRALEPLRAQLQATGKLPALPDCHVDVLTLTKGQ